jgi:hypothetical protein
VRVNRVHVEVLHTGACPHWRAARNRVELLARRDGVAVAVTETVVDTLEQARARRFHGSPTVLVEGCDVESQAAAVPADYGLG